MDYVYSLMVKNKLKEPKYFLDPLCIFLLLQSFSSVAHLWQPTHNTTIKMVTTKAEAAAMAPSSNTLP